MIVDRKLVLAVAWSVAAGACATAAPLTRNQCYDADRQLAAVLQPFEALRARGCDASTSVKGPAECARLRAEIDRQLLVCPAHAPTLLANAVVAYDERNLVKAQQLLDDLLAQERSHPSAAALRARIAIDEGNVPFATRLLNQQIRLTPDDAGLHETLSAALFLERRFPEAVREMNTAAALGAPKWRVAYHLGVLAEATGRFDEARTQFAAAVEGNPGWAPARSRLNALRAQAEAKP